MWKELTVSLTPAFYMEGDWLFKMQLNCLSKQEFKDFTVLVIDAHYQKRVGYMAELAEYYGLSIIHLPYQPNLSIAKKLDCAVFNAAYCYSESKRIVRYSCWRLVAPDFTKCCIESKTNLDFYFHSCDAPNLDRFDVNTSHDTGIWSGKDDIVHWENVPRVGQQGATWTKESEMDTPIVPFPKNAFGNYMVFRDEWLNINGCNEAFNTTHFEDMCFTIMANNEGMTCERKALKLFRLHHQYGSHSGRANIKPDFSFRKPCVECEFASVINEPTRYNLKHRVLAGEVEIFEDSQIWVCKTCGLSGAVYHADCGEYTGWLEKNKITQAPIIETYKIGRNLKLLTADMDGKSIAEKYDIYTDSWTNQKYYTK